jgi:hypothetical protein
MVLSEAFAAVRPALVAFLPSVIQRTTEEHGENVPDYRNGRNPG